MDITVQDEGMQHTDTMRDVVSLTQEVLQEEKYTTKTPPVISEPN